MSPCSLGKRESIRRHERKKRIQKSKVARRKMKFRC